MSSTFHAAVLHGEHDEMGALRTPHRERGTASSQHDRGYRASSVPRADRSRRRQFKGAQHE